MFSTLQLLDYNPTKWEMQAFTGKESDGTSSVRAHPAPRSKIYILKKRALFKINELLTERISGGAKKMSSGSGKSQYLH